MSSHLPPRDVKKAIDLLQAYAARAWTIDTLAQPAASRAALWRSISAASLARRQWIPSHSAHK
jgi:hypothetical protein